MLRESTWSTFQNVLTDELLLWTALLLFVLLVERVCFVAGRILAWFLLWFGVVLWIYQILFYLVSKQPYSNPLLLSWCSITLVPIGKVKHPPVLILLPWMICVYALLGLDCACVELGVFLEASINLFFFYDVLSMCDLPSALFWYRSHFFCGLMLQWWVWSRWRAGWKKEHKWIAWNH